MYVFFLLGQEDGFFFFFFFLGGFELFLEKEIVFRKSFLLPEDHPSQYYFVQMDLTLKFLLEPVVTFLIFN